eukprot:scaffold92149_cov29-Phaeocystis_antarctica.AAC.2
MTLSSANWLTRAAVPAAAGATWAMGGLRAGAASIRTLMRRCACLSIKHEVGGQLSVWGQAGHFDSLLDQIQPCCSR